MKTTRVTNLFTITPDDVLGDTFHEYSSSHWVQSRVRENHSFPTPTTTRKQINTIQRRNKYHVTEEYRRCGEVHNERPWRLRGRRLQWWCPETCGVGRRQPPAVRALRADTDLSMSVPWRPGVDRWFLAGNPVVCRVCDISGVVCASPPPRQHATSLDSVSFAFRLFNSFPSRKLFSRLPSFKTSPLSCQTRSTALLSSSDRWPDFFFLFGFFLWKDNDEILQITWKNRPMLFWKRH